jgi:molybdopterin-guanine dinucleotide biosynthesis protein A
MGHEKALLELSGEPLIVRALSILRSTGLHPAIAGARSNLAAFGLVVEDAAFAPGKGPLSGVCAALAVTQARYAVFLPVDMPFLPSALIEYMVAHAMTTRSPVTIPSVNGRLQTFPAVIDRQTLPFLERQLQSEALGTLSAFKRAVNELTQDVSTLPVELLVQSGHVAHPLSLPTALWFLNVNSPRDLARAQLVARTA